MLMSAIAPNMRLIETCESVVLFVFVSMVL